MYIEIIDDNEQLALHIQKSCRKRWDTTKVYNSRDQFLHGSDFKADLFIMDINLWDGNWLDLIEHLRLIEKVTTPIIIISWQTISRIKEEWFAVWADDFIEKPFSISDLYERIDTIFSHISMRSSSECWCSEKKLYSCLSENEQKKLFWKSLL